MSEYKELVDRLKYYADTAEDMIYGVCVNAPEAMKAAADAIEQLIKERDVLQLQNHLERCEHEHTRKERDAAVADLKEINLCYWCYNNNKHIVGKNKETQADVDIGECGQGGGLFHQLTLSGRRSWCEHFEWRGVQDECRADLGANLGGSSVFVDKSAKALTIASDYVLKIGSTAVSESQLQELLALLDGQ